MSFTTLASDVLVLAAGAAATTAVAMASHKSLPFQTSLGTENDDDSLCTPLPQPSASKKVSTAADAAAAKKLQGKEVTALAAKATKLGDVQKTVATTVTVEEVVQTPGVKEIKGDSLFVGVKAA